MATKWGRYLFFFLIFEIFLWRFCAFLNKGSSKTPKNNFEGNPCQQLLAEKVEKRKLFYFRLFPSIFFIAFLAVSLQNTVKIFSQSDLKISKNLKKGR
jgi:hypothetical protein